MVFQEAINVVFVIKNYEEKDIANIFKRLLCLIIERCLKLKKDSLDVTKLKSK